MKTRYALASAVSLAKIVTLFGNDVFVWVCLFPDIALIGRSSSQWFWVLWATSTVKFFSLVQITSSVPIASHPTISLPPLAGSELHCPRVPVLSGYDNCEILYSSFDSSLDGSLEIWRSKATCFTSEWFYESSACWRIAAFLNLSASTCLPLRHYLMTWRKVLWGILSCFAIVSGRSPYSRKWAMKKLCAPARISSSRS